jgi:hypothetical protein
MRNTGARADAPLPRPPGGPATLDLPDQIGQLLLGLVQPLLPFIANRLDAGESVQALADMDQALGNVQNLIGCGA